MSGGRLFPSFSWLEFLRNLWIAEIIFVEVKEVQAQAVLHFALAQIVQVRLPMPVFGEVVGHMPGQKNVPRIAAIHYALRDIDSRSRYIRFVVNIPNPIDRTAVNSHPQPGTGMILQRSANLKSTPHRFFRAVEENERHPIAGRHSDEFAACFRRAKTFGISHDLIKFLQHFNLLVDEKFRITHYVD